MRVDRPSFFVILGGVAVAAAASVACSSAPPGDAEGATAAATRAPFDRNDVLDDTSLSDAQAMSAADVQRFFDETPWGTRSVLATYEEDGKTAAEIIVSVSQKYGLNPLELLVRAQMEQGLVNKTTAKQATIDIAFGCGCPHSPVCSDKYMGFANQAECAAGTLSRSMAAATTTRGTVSGWARSRAKETEDGLTVTPKNAATAALYTYTPWVGEAGGGRAGVGGASLHHAVWDRFATAVGYGAWASQETTTTTQAPESSTADASTGEPELDPAVDASAPEPEPAPDAGEGDPDPAASPDAGSAGSDAGSAPATDEGTSTNESTPPSDGADDSAVLSEGNAPPASNAPPPRPSAGRHAPEDLPEATEEELSRKPKTSEAGGCSMSASTSTTGGASGEAVLFGLGLVTALARSRKRATAKRED